ncbi:PREDICTED: thyrotropin-releasing hormone-degrading ectoenzyme-like [Trachymyrmex septentrionalis]|uniref:thyrotropin-releasing hormone-degrading ectoenzyme-like n=1 Tax=Trachymyrmex septentrionalis TaxID=34720 RepID=UPI00084EE011|nr:PREDICTED: thyrotropin-releasing hormone-degrading ectoenzyme-like [Trachymyrmex septentrionalis]
MRRGSVSSWQSYGQRNSDCMMQTYEGNTALPPPCEEIIHQRKGGWFLTYKKILSFVVLIVIVVIIAGIIGWNLGTIPKTRIYDPLALIEEEVEEGGDVMIASVSPFVHPLKYNLELTLSNDINATLKLKGRVIIEFHVDDTTPLNQLSLNARNITATRYKLSLIEENDARAKRRRRRRAEDTGGQENADNATTLAPTVMSSSQLENQDTIRVVTEYPSGNATISGSETSSLTNESSSVPDEKIAKSTNATTGLVTSIMITSGNESITDVEIQRYEVDANNGLHVIYPAVAMSSGIYILEIDYEILFDGKAIYSTSYSESSEGKLLIGTRLKPVRASHLLPIFDDVKLKAVFSMSVVHPHEVRVLSNMPLNISKDLSSDQVIDIFSDTPLLSPYNLAFVMGEIESVGETKMGLDNVTGVTFWGDPKRRSRGIYLLDKLDQIVVHLNDMFLMPYPLPKLDIVALPSRIVDNAGSPGLISLKQSLFYAADRSPMVTKTDALSALISLIGEQWLGGVVNMKNWTDIWLLEGSTLYLRHEMIEKIDSSLSSNLAFLANVQWEAMEEDSYSVSRPLQSNINPANLDFSDRNIRHKKGACLIRMLHGVINDTAFRNGYQKFIARWNYSTANVDDFWEAMAEEAIGLPMGITLAEAMNSWISHRGYPIVSVMRKYKEDIAIIRQQRFTYDQSSDIQPTWYVPLDYINKTSNDWSSPTKTWLHSETEMVMHNIGGQDSWIVFNVNKTGYYRVHYDEENWKLLTQALEENHEILPAETRASLIDDVLGLAAVGLTKYATAFDFIKYMQIKERHYAPWGTLMRHLLKLNGLLYETSGFSAFQEFTLRFTSKLYADVGWKVDEGSQLTLTTLTIACAFENAECLDWARNHFAKLKDHPDADEVVPAYAREVLYCTIARYGTRNEWNYFVERANSTADRDEKNRLLSAFACFQTPWILQLILSEILEGKMYDEDETQRILRSFPQNPVAAQIAYKFVQNNWQVIVTRFSKSRPILKAFALAMTNGLISEEDFEDFQTFSEDNLESIKIVGYTMAMVEAHAKFAIKWLKESLPEVQEWLAANNSTETLV